MRKAKYPILRLAATQAVIASEAKQSPSRKEEIASAQNPCLAMTNDRRELNSYDLRN
jgi:hypothetical protein